MNSLWKQLTAAGAASGKPGDHGRSLKWLNRNHNSKLRQATASGHEPRSQAEGRTHQNLRSVESISRRLQNYRSTRQLNRCNYRKWNAQVREAGFFTLACLHGPSERVKLSTHQIRRAYPPHISDPYDNTTMIDACCICGTYVLNIHWEVKNIVHKSTLAFCDKISMGSNNIRNIGEWDSCHE